MPEKLEVKFFHEVGTEVARGLLVLLRIQYMERGISRTPGTGMTSKVFSQTGPEAVRLYRRG